MLRSLLLLVALLSSAPLFAAPRYHLELEANPAAVFPYLRKFGAVEVHLYPSGVRTNAFWLYAFSKAGTNDVTVANPLGRMYVNVPVRDIAPTLMKLAGAAGALERSLAPVAGPTARGKVSGLDAVRHRLVYGPGGWIDVWSTNEIPENAQYRRIVDQLVGGISPGTAAAARKIPGTPIFVELNFSRFRKVALLKVRKITFEADADDEEDALELGPIYMKAPLLDKLLSQ
jgi:hypothetical protein